MFNGTLISDFKQKANLFNSYFSSQCTPIDTSSKLPVFAYKTENRLDSVDITEEDIYLIIKGPYIHYVGGGTEGFLWGL